MKDKPRARPPLKIAVTGAAGFIGRRVVARLAEAGAQVVALDRLPRAAGFPAGVEYICGELKDFPAVGNGSILVHLAWNMDRADPKAQAASVSDFIRLLGTNKWQGIVGLGSAEEYGEREGRLSEAMAPGLKLSAYGKAKQEACRALETWTRESAGRRAVWLRPFVVYGPGQGGNMAIPYALRCATERTPAEFSEGLQSRDFVHVDDVAAGIAQAALRWPEPGEAFEVCNLGFGQPVRLREVLERISKRKRAQKWFRFGARPMRAGEPQEQYADTSAAADRLGWRARISWQQGIDALCQETEKDNRG